MPRTLPLAAAVLLLASCGSSTTAPPPPPPPPAPTVQSITVSPPLASLTSIGQSVTLTAEVRLSNGAVGNQAVTWSTSAAGIATVSSGTVTAVANGQSVITASIGSVSGTANLTVAQAVASVRLLPGDSVIKSVVSLRGAALDARPQIWTEVNPYCGGQYFVDQINWSACPSPTWKHFFILPGVTPNDHHAIARFLAWQFFVASNTVSPQTPWFMEGYTQWLMGGAAGTNGITGKAQPVSIADFKTGDTQGLLAPLDTLILLPAAKYYENHPQRTPVAVRMAQGVAFVSYLATETQSSALCKVFAAIRATPGAGLSNDALIQVIVTATGKTIAELEAGYLVHARALAGGAVAQATVVPRRLSALAPLRPRAGGPAARRRTPSRS